MMEYVNYARFNNEDSEMHFEKCMKAARQKLLKQYDSGEISRAELEYELDNIGYNVAENRFERRQREFYGDDYEAAAM